MGIQTQLLYATLDQRLFGPQVDVLASFRGVLDTSGTSIRSRLHVIFGIQSDRVAVRKFATATNHSTLNVLLGFFLASSMEHVGPSRHATA